MKRNGGREGAGWGPPPYSRIHLSNLRWIIVFIDRAADPTLEHLDEQHLSVRHNVVRDVRRKAGGHQTESVCGKKKENRGGAQRWGALNAGRSAARMRTQREAGHSRPEPRTR